MNFILCQQTNHIIASHSNKAYSLFYIVPGSLLARIHCNKMLEKVLSVQVQMQQI